MTLQEIDSILTEAFLSRKAVIIQLNLKDEFGRLLDEVEGHFIGEAYEDYFMIDHQPILWEDVRYIELKETKMVCDMRGCDRSDQLQKIRKDFSKIAS